MSIGLIVNANCRQIRLHPERIWDLEAAVDRAATVAQTRSMSDLTLALHEFRKKRVATIAIAGGDGTLHATVTHAARIYGEHGDPIPAVAPIPCGTMNIVARSIGVRKRSTPHARDLIARLKAGRAHRCTRHLLSIEERLGWMFGAGILERFLSEYYETGAPSARTAAKMFANVVLGSVGVGNALHRIHRPFRGSVELREPSGRGATWPERDHLAIAAGTIDELGFGFRPFCRFDAVPNSFHALGILTSPRKLAAYLPRVRLGKSLPSHVALQSNACAMTLRSGSPIRYMLDGELYEAGTALDVSIGGTVELIR